MGTKPCATVRKCGEVLKHDLTQLGARLCGRGRGADGQMVDTERYPTVGALQLEQLGLSAIGIGPVEVNRVGRQVDQRRLVNTRPEAKCDAAEFDDAIAGKEAGRVFLVSPPLMGQLFGASTRGAPDVVDDKAIVVIRNAKVHLACLQRQLLQAGRCAPQITTRAVGTKIRQPIADAVDVRVGSVRGDVNQSRAAASCASALAKIVDQLQDGPSRHAHTTTLVELLLEAQHSDDRRTAVGVNDNVKAEWQHRQCARDRLQLCWVDAGGAGDI